MCIHTGVQKPQDGDQKALEELGFKKAELIKELFALDLKSKNLKSTESVPGSLPPGTVLTYVLIPDLENGCVSLKVDVNTEAQIINIVAIDTGIYIYIYIYIYRWIFIGVKISTYISIHSHIHLLTHI
jgi:hypothetical protein